MVDKPGDKKDKKPEGKGIPDDASVAGELFTLIIVLALLGVVANRVMNYFSNLDAGDLGPANYFLDTIWPVWKVMAVFISLLAIVGIVYNLRKLGEINAKEEELYNPNTSEGGEATQQPKNQRWEKVQELAYSNSPSDWRLAIIEADVMLEDVLRQKGHIEDNLGDMLKATDKTDLLTLQDAWEAHKVRNDIAHLGANFELSDREAKRVVALFENVFK